MTAKKIAFQGEPGANSHLACSQAYPDYDPLPCATFEDCFTALSNGDADLGMIPIENSVAGRVADPRRVAYLHGHLLAARDAIEAGVPLDGYFAWSLLDNFEWAEGYTKRFGITYVDFATQERTIKDSGRFFAETIRANGENL